MAERARKGKLTCIQCSKVRLQMKKKEERDRDKLGDKLKAFLIRKEEEDEATCLVEEMRKNLEAAKTQKF